MVPQKLLLVRGDDSIAPLVVYEPDGTGDPYDLTAATLELTVSDGDDVVWTKAGGSGIVVTDAEDGKLTVAFAASDWDAWDDCMSLTWALRATRFALVSTLGYGTIEVVDP